MTATAPDRQAGFSLVELMIAMVITLIVTGAIYGLLSGGESAFRLQPEKTDIQQNGRSAMDMIMRDISSAGVGMPNFIQTFTPGLNACAGCPNGGSPMGVLGAVPTVADELEIVTNQENFRTEDVCYTASDPAPANSGHVDLIRDVPDFSAPPTKGVLVFTEAQPLLQPQWAAQQVSSIGSDSTATATNACDNLPHPKLNFVSGGPCTPMTPLAFGNATAGNCNVTQVSFGAVVHYRIRPDLTDPTNPMPSLWRLSTADLASGYQIVARGIDDMQVQYVQASNAAPCTLAVPCDNAPPVSQVAPAGLAEYGTLITQVRVTLSARSTLRGNLQGQRTVSGVSALRGQITSTGSPRAALFALTQQPGTPQWH